MRCNSNCSCNNGCNGGNQNGFSRCSQRNECRPSAFFANSTTTQPATITADTPATFVFNNILYNFGCAVQAAPGATTLFITKPGLYRVSTSVVATNTAATAATITTSLLKNTIVLATNTGTTDATIGAAVTLSSEILLYVACNELPVALSLTATSDVETVTYTAAIVINKICLCNNSCNDFILPTQTPAGTTPFFFGFGNSGCGCPCSLGDDCNTGCNNGCSNGCSQRCSDNSNCCS